MNAVIYARFSSARQNETSISGQISSCSRYAKDKGYNIVDTYVDRAISGTTDERPQFQNMIYDSRFGNFDVVLVYKIDRFSRNRYDAQVYRKKLKDNNVRVISCTEPIEEGSNGIIMEAIYDGFSEWYSANLSENVKRGMKENAKLGNFLGGTLPLGYKVEGKKLVVDNEKAEAVRIIFKMYVDGYTKGEIAKYLNARGYTTSFGKQFKINSFNHILKNEKYTGIYNSNGECIKDGVPAIISKDLFDKAQFLLDQKRINKKASRGYVLTGICKCSCGGDMTGYSSYGRGKIKYQKYRCKECMFKIDKNVLEDKVIETSIKYILNGNVKNQIINKTLELYNSIDFSSEIKSLNKEINKNKEKIDNAVDLLLETPSMAKVLNAKIFELEKVNSDLMDKLNDMEFKQSKRLTRADIEKTVDEFDIVDLESDEERNMFINSMVKLVEVNSESIKIHYAFSNIVYDTDLVVCSNGGLFGYLIEPNISISNVNGNLVIIVKDSL